MHVEILIFSEGVTLASRHANLKNAVFWWEASEVYSSALAWEGVSRNVNCSNPKVCYDINFAFAV